VITPVEDPELCKDLQEILGIMLADNRHAWDLQLDGRYIQRHPNTNGSKSAPEPNGSKQNCGAGVNGSEQDSQTIFMEMAAQSVG
jgi:polyphosphate kinase